jgi:hypothetical protein
MSFFGINGKNFELSYKKEDGQEILSLEFKDNSDGSAILSHPICRNCEIIFDQHSVMCLKEIDSNLRKYTFKTNGELWGIYQITTNNSSGHDFPFIVGDMKYDGRKIICINPKVNPVQPPPPTVL